MRTNIITLYLIQNIWDPERFLFYSSFQRSTNEIIGEQICSFLSEIYGICYNRAPIFLPHQHINLGERLAKNSLLKEKSYRSGGCWLTLVFIAISDRYWAFYIYIKHFLIYSHQFCWADIQKVINYKLSIEELLSSRIRLLAGNCSVRSNAGLNRNYHCVNSGCHEYEHMAKSL